MNPALILKVIPLTDTSDQTMALEEMFHSLSGDLDEHTLNDLTEAVILREETSPTYLEHGLAVPHGRIKSLGKIVISVGINKNGIDWPHEEDKAKLVVLVGVPAPMVTGYLKILQKLIRWHRHSSLINADGSIDDGNIAGLEQELKTLLT